MQLTTSAIASWLWGAFAVGWSILAIVYLGSGDVLLGIGGVVVALCGWAVLVVRLGKARPRLN